MKLKPWKYIVAVWITGIIIAGFLIPIPDIPILEQSARNLFFHVPMWFTMFVCFGVGFVYSIKYLNSNDIAADRKASTATQIGVLFGVCGLLTGSIWARFTWGTWWTFAEPRMNLAALGMMIYVAYFVLRTAFDNPEKRAKISAVFNVFAATTIPFLMYIIPRQLPSLHPGAEGNPAFSEITAPELRYVFYPAVVGFIALAVWLNDVLNRYKKIKHQTKQQV
ncbi:MAG TPA: cytochrome c biogenesis protein CcsA [Balneolaceae bacterium]|nr:cytochrome c biogenesis protein CcsA [Balneolaceae bacterium]